ncbi:MAG: hypothetical protein HN352_05345 [Bacteroidetes bacterium]|nr:hypothetical protein [Bacteroidota bacterium]MBT5427661.1 hypothetical protein [Bacteroidota bacterium]MBT7464685.1 hypothetical protein [Bacteroidota bacterium]
MIEQIQTELPIWLASLGLMLAIFLSLFSYSGKKAKELFTLPKRVLLGLLRGITVFLIFILFMGFLWKSRTEIREKPIALVALDNSSSMVSTADSLLVKASVNKLLGDLQALADDELELKIYSFGNSIGSGVNPDFQDKQTNFGQLFDHLTTTYLHRPVQELLIISDGIYTSGPDPSTAARKFPFPVSVWAVGDSVPMPDLKITGVRVNDVVYANTKFPVDIKVEGIDLDQYQVRLSLSSEGQALVDTIMSVDPIDGIGNVSLHIDFSKIGNHVFDVSVEPFANESNLHNNKRSYAVEVIDEKIKVILLYHNPHPDVRVIKSNLEKTDRYDLQVQNIADFHFVQDEYQLIIFYQLPTGRRAEQEKLDRIRQSDTNILFVIGPETNLNSLTVMGVGVSFKADRLLTEDYNPVLNEQFSVFTYEEGFKDFLKKMPPLKAPFASISIKSRSNILLFQKIKDIELADPLFWFGTYQSRKFGFIWGEGLWRWQLYEYLNNDNLYYTGELLLKTVNYLSTNEIKDPLRLQVPKTINISDDLTVKAKLYNKSLEAITTPEVYFTITGPEDYVKKMDFRRVQNGYQLQLIDLKPGRYKYTAYTNLDNLEYRKSGVIDVLNTQLEQLDLTARPDNLRELAYTSNGRFFKWDESSDILTSFNDNDRAQDAIIPLTEWNNLLNIPIILIIIVILLSVEWLLRRWAGTR